ncbi:MAG TPA: SAM-dependent methyltransferase, partial [Streptosporangiaceae bacterium]|nr:SAM-dependent methyltransferase [Streptosporangiaceae bacterium]
VPYGRQVAWSNRHFLLRAVKYLAGKGIGQFIDLGPGIPVQPYVHEVAQKIVPNARIAYIDNDPIATSHNRSLLASHNGHVLAMHGDIRSPCDILLDEQLGGFIDFTRPVGVLFVAVLHFLTGQDDPYRTVKVFRDHVPSGSYVAISHITSEGTRPYVISTVQEAYTGASAPVVFRSRHEIEALLAGFELVAPGLVEVSDWRSSHRGSAHPPALRFLAGVGRKV